MQSILRQTVINATDQGIDRGSWWWREVSHPSVLQILQWTYQTHSQMCTSDPFGWNILPQTSPQLTVSAKFKQCLLKLPNTWKSHSPPFCFFCFFSHKSNIWNKLLIYVLTISSRKNMSSKKARLFVLFKHVFQSLEQCLIRSKV